MGPSAGVGYVRGVNASSPPSGRPAGGPAAVFEAPSAPGRIVLLTTSHRVAPGLLSWPAWQALRDGGPGAVRGPRAPAAAVSAGGGRHGRARGARPAESWSTPARAAARSSSARRRGEGDRPLTDGLARLGGSGRVAMPDLELLPGSYDLPGARLLDLVQVMDRIRRRVPVEPPRTHEGLAKYAHRGDVRTGRGDRGRRPRRAARGTGRRPAPGRLPRRASPRRTRTTPFSIDDVAGGIVDKLIHRHPHVFGDETAETPEEVQAHWLRTKAVEKPRESVTDGVPLRQPALALAAKLAARARTAGLDVPLPTADGKARSARARGTRARGRGHGGQGRRRQGREGHGRRRLGYQLLALAARAESDGRGPGGGAAGGGQGVPGRDPGCRRGGRLAGPPRRTCCLSA